MRSPSDGTEIFFFFNSITFHVLVLLHQELTSGSSRLKRNLYSIPWFQPEVVFHHSLLKCTAADLSGYHLGKKESL